jgi:hypothetical protein
MNKKTPHESLSSEEFEAAYVKYACDELTHNTMTRGEFAKQIEINEEFAKKFVPNHFDNTIDLSYNNDTEIR